MTFGLIKPGHVPGCHNLDSTSDLYGELCDCPTATYAEQIAQRLTTRFTRRQHTANVADPTTVVQWTSPKGRVKLIASWDVEAKVTLFGKTWRTYANPHFVWLFGVLEDRYNAEQACYDDDPMGRMGDYV